MRGPWSCGAPEELSITRVTERLGSGRWAPGTRWTSYQTIYLHEKQDGKMRKKSHNEKATLHSLRLIIRQLLHQNDGFFRNPTMICGAGRSEHRGMQRSRDWHRSWRNHFSIRQQKDVDRGAVRFICVFAFVLTSISVPKEVSIDVMDVGVDGGTTGDTARGHVGIILWVDVLKALPWHAWAEF